MIVHRPPVRVVIPIIVLVVIGLVVWAILASRPKAPSDTIMANGTVEATEVDVSPKVAGHILRLTVDEGSSVEQGQVVAVLDGAEVKAQVEQAQGALNAAKARLADLQQGSRPEDIRRARAAVQQAQAVVAGARTNLNLAQQAYAQNSEARARYVNAKAAYEAAGHARDQARARLNEVERGARSEDIQQAEAAVAQARAESRNAQENANRAEQLLERGAISRQDRDAAVTRRDVAAAALNNAEARLAEVRAGATSEQLEQARAAYSQAQAQLEGARQNYEAVSDLFEDRTQLKQQLESARTQYSTAQDQLEAAQAQLDLLIAGPTRQAIEAARGQVEQAQGALSAAKANQAYLTLKAPVSGTVILKNAEAGDLVTVGMPIVRIANLDSVWVRVYVPLPELQVKAGDTADVTTEAYPGRTFPGKVVEISSQPEFTPKNVQTEEQRTKLVYGVKVELANLEHDLKPGMPAEATIYLHRAAENRG